jgi:ribosomal protein S18 acetylase RimI-like enzyme
MNSSAISIDDIHFRNELLLGDMGYIAYMHGLIYARECGYGLSFERYVLEGLQEFASHYNPTQDRVWICEYRAQMIGFLIGVHRGDAVQLRYFIFLPEYRGLGLGKRLMDSFMAYMKEKGFQKAYLWTTNEQLAATSLYTRYGFKLTEEKTSEAFNKLLTECRYDLVIS